MSGVPKGAIGPPCRPASCSTGRWNCLDEPLFQKAMEKILLDNLQRLGILRLDTPQLEDGEIQDPDYMQLTELGLRVLKTCNEPPAARSSG